MFGTEYSWLITHSTDGDRAPQVRLASPGLLTLGVGVFCFVCYSLRAEVPPPVLMQEARAAVQTGDLAQAIAKFEAVRAARPDYPRVHNTLARCYTEVGRTEDALKSLQTLAAMGLVVNIATDKDFARLQSRPEFSAIVQAFAANRPTETAPVAWTLPEMTGIIEGIAIRPETGETFLADVHERCIWRRDAQGVVKKFSQESEALPGLFALRVDSRAKRLWASGSALPEMRGYTAADRGRALLAAFDLTNGRLLATYPAPADGANHVVGDFTIASDGTIYATDSLAPILWRLSPNGSSLEKWLESDQFSSLQGVVQSADGAALYVSDYANGLWRVDLATRAIRLLPAPPHTTLFGIDGLQAVPGGLIAVQNGINPPRILRLSLDATGLPTAAKVLFAGDAATSDFSLGQVVGDHFEFVGTSGWGLFENAKTPPAPHPVKIYRTRLE